MLIISRFENKIKLKPQVEEDLWHLQKIIKPSDFVSASTHRKFIASSGNAERKRVYLKIKVEKTEFHKGFGKLRVLGVIVEGKPEEYVQIGEHHSIDIGLNDELKIQKEKWMKYELDRIKEAEQNANKQKLIILIMDEREAELFSIKVFGIDSLGKIRLKGAGKYSDEKNKQKDYEELANLLLNKTADKIVLAGSGFEKDNFFNYLKDKQPKLSKKVFITNACNPGKRGVYELIEKDVFSKIIQQHRLIEETKAIEEFTKKLVNGLATYGLKQVEEALDYGAVDKLLVLDSLLLENKEEIKGLISKAEKIGSKVILISHENQASEKLKAFNGVIAILRFKIE